MNEVIVFVLGFTITLAIVVIADVVIETSCSYAVK